MVERNKKSFFLSVGQITWLAKMGPSFEIFDPPTLLSSESFLTDWPDETGQYRRFFEFEWHGEKYWLTGSSLKSGPAYCGQVLILPKGKRKPISCRLLVATGIGGMGFRVERPPKLPKVGPTQFFFIGFQGDVRIERGFLQSEERRIESLFALSHKGYLGPLERPPPGTVV